MRYKVYSEHLQRKYREKVYKIPINLPLTCPNRDGSIGTDGCTFCAEVGAGFECLSSGISVEEQLEKNGFRLVARLTGIPSADGLQRFSFALRSLLYSGEWKVKKILASANAL